MKRFKCTVIKTYDYEIEIDNVRFLDTLEGAISNRDF